MSGIRFSFDALIAASCLELALERSTKVKFCLDDAPLYDVIHQLSAYKSAIQFRFIGTPRTTLPSKVNSNRLPDVRLWW
jgi:hypothetical protein